MIAYVEPHALTDTIAMIGDLEIVPRRPMEYRGSTFEEMDLDAVLRRAPQVALVDELAYTTFRVRHTGNGGKTWTLCSKPASTC